jgi:hypothetical protein
MKPFMKLHAAALAPLTGTATGCRGNCDQGRRPCDCTYSDEVLGASAPSPCDPSPALNAQPSRWLSFAVVVIAVLSVAGWIGWHQ